MKQSILFVNIVTNACKDWHKVSKRSKDISSRELFAWMQSSRRECKNLEQLSVIYNVRCATKKIGKIEVRLR